ncbi:putative scaffold protein [Salmonella phage SGPC]|uniref:putative scaffold protein n=1 Tax=Salmonella phage SGPC TaxID=2877945 RepID=UPI00240EC142|nr:putative scaffold protein [Salmonella phage SGPC]UCR75447.1 putative scaffold protein [Salmonella phage SGPC]
MNRFLRYPLHEEAGVEDKPGAGDVPKMYTAEEVQALIEKEVAGLKANQEALLSEKKEAARRAKEAEEERQRAHQEALKAAGKMDEFEKTIRSQYEPVLKEKEERYASLAARILGSERKAVLGSFAGDFITPEAVEILAPFVKTEFDGEDVVTKFMGADGNVVTTDPEQFRKYLREHKAFSHLIKANAASGGGASGNKGGGAAPAFKDMSESERLALYKSNPAEFERQLKALRK